VTPPASVEADPARALAGRPVAGLAEGGVDAVLRIGQPGWALPEAEALLDIHGDRVLSGIGDPDGSNARLRVRDLEGTLIHTIEAGFNIPQAAIVRGDEVFFAGVQADPDGDDLDFEDRGVWVARGEEPPQLVVAESGVARYHELHLSPDGRTLGIWACGFECSSVLVDRSGRTLKIDQPGLDALTNQAAVLLASWSGIVAHDVSTGTELWRRESDGTNWGRHALADGRRLIHSVIEDEGDPDQLRMELIDAATGTVELTVRVPADGPGWYVSPTLSTDRFAVLVPSVLPDAEDAPIGVMVVDLDDGEIVDVDLALGPLAPD
jgi:hypothetical protein